ncbi:ribosome silencing factor [Reichenbachiella sp. 5M10]|uniref:ribosome silencing factor n=1 Tax=Reichenbachiella sp. 5M10 TaxID=1889772 RepID=UPI000C14C91A|nr:ribosome silencing factor [Reichenbachiella sp. 5M10]PIB36511.1 ribosome silencing factor [Reichenbachiella sp. 5M10]
MTEVKDVQKSENLEQVVVQGMQEIKASDIVVMDLREISNSVAKYFVICSGNSDTHLDSIAQSVEEEVYKSLKIDPWHKEGRENKEWILLDYADVVVHIFRKDRREFYSLEKLWGDAVVSKVE